MVSTPILAMPRIPNMNDAIYVDYCFGLAAILNFKMAAILVLHIGTYRFHVIYDICKHELNG